MMFEAIILGIIQGLTEFLPVYDPLVQAFYRQEEWKF